MAKKITLLEVSNYKKIRDITIAPGDHSMILVGGRNRQGKSSLLGAMSAALGGRGEAAEEPIRKGQKRADITITFEGLVIHRKFNASGTSKLTVTVDGEEKKAPQKILDKLLNGRFLNPLRIMGQDDKTQRATLLKCVTLDIDLAAHAKERAAVFATRTDANREAKRLEAELAALSVVEIPEPVSADDLFAELERLEDNQRRGEGAVVEQVRMREVENEWVSSLNELESAVSHAVEVSRLARLALEEERARHEEWLTAAKVKTAALDEVAVLAGIDTLAEIENARDALRDATAASQEHARLVAASERRVDVGERGRAKVREADDLTDKLASLDEQKAAALAAADMPIAGLDVDESRVLYGGLPLSQASGAEQLQVSLAIAAAMSPELGDIWVEDGALLDDDSLELVRAFADENDLRVWLERVGEGDAEAVIIEEGEVKQ